jgi:hypothetical protein
MANFDGEISTNPVPLQGGPIESGYSMSLIVTKGIQDGYGSIRQNTSPTFCPPIVIYYALSMFDNIGIRHFWTDTSISIANAPAGPTYNVSTFAVEGLF